ncbi:MAG TPA: Ig-like domain-containing protein [Solirubrobacteraceae bacterium]|nr:Ig-like domain-containing protein [Solirubrobacteraceae bacterium]
MAVATHLPSPVSSGAASPASTAGLDRLQSLPLQAQSVISSTIAADSRAFAAHRTASGWGLSGGGIRADFRAGEPTLTAGANTLSLSLMGAGAATSVSAHRNRVMLSRPGIQEWYAAGPLGIEQGFTLAHHPAALASGHQLTLALAVGGALSARRAGSDIELLGSRHDIVARYGGLTAVDATGRHLPGALSVDGGRVVITVNDRGARYPLTVDPLLQQGKLVPNNLKTMGASSAFGASVALSSDGDTALIGATQDNSDKGSVWIFSRTGSTWSQGQEIEPTDASAPPAAGFGNSVALSADGKTALIGGEFDNGQTGAVWVYVQSPSGYVEQARMPSAGVPVTGLNGADQFGHSVTLSGDGNTAVVGALDNDGSAGAGNDGGAAFVFTRSGVSWSQLGSKIAPAVAPSNNADHWGTAVALSSDGTTALIGGPNEGPGSGAAWVYTRAGSAAFSPQQELFASPASSLVQFGSSVALSANGNTALIGAPADTAGTGGAAWAFTRSGTTWGSGTKILPTNSPSGVFGSAVALSADGSTALIGAEGMTPDLGAAFFFTQAQGAWSQQQILTGSGEVGFGFFGTSVALASDGQTAMIGAPGDTSGSGAAFAFAPPSPVCNSVAATTPQGGGSTLVSLSCSLPFGAHPDYTILGGPSNGTVSGFNGGTGQLTYSSAALFSGQDSFTYRVSDQWGISNIATATITTPFLPVPKCSNVTTKGKAGATRVTVTLKCTGPKGHAFTYGIVSKPGNGKLGKINQSKGKVTYTTHIGAQGNDRFVYNASDAGGSSKPATATIKLPFLHQITTPMHWDFNPTTATFSQLNSMSIDALPGGAKAILSCKAKKGACSISTHTVSVPKHKVCKTKGKGKNKKRTCKRVAPKQAFVNLTRFVAGKHLSVGTKLTVTMFEPGWIGKRFVFTIVKSQQPPDTVTAMAPGSSTRLCPKCSGTGQ